MFKHHPIVHVECMAHLRRYLLNAIKSDERQALPLFKDITKLYRIERQAKERALTHEQHGLLPSRQSEAGTEGSAGEVPRPHAPRRPRK